MFTASGTNIQSTPRLANASHTRVLWAGAFGLTTMFALLYALRGGIAALDRGETVAWSNQVVVSLAVWWTCLPLLPVLAWLVRIAPLGGEKRIRNGFVLLTGTLAAAVVRHYLLTPVVTWSTGTPDAPASAVARTLTYFTTFLVIVGMLHAVHYYRGLRAHELASSEMSRALAEARLAALRAQLQPHFVFNALNAIAALLHTDPIMADRMLTRFAALLRSVLAESAVEEHSLRDELVMLNQYLELMQLRFGDRLALQWNVDDSLLDCQVPWLVLQPLVENALEHGLGNRTEPGLLRISASALGDTLRLTVEDNGVGIREIQRPDGVGLGNTRERLKQLYGADGILALQEAPEGGTSAVVELPIHVRRAAMSVNEH